MSPVGDTPPFTQPLDFRAESDALYALLADLKVEDFKRPTRFKQWTITDIVTHLHVWNWPRSRRWSIRRR